MSELRPSDLARFQRFGITAEPLQSAGIERVTDEEAREQYGIRGTGAMDGIVYPYVHPRTGNRTTCRLRRDHPEIEEGQEKRKYISPFGDSRHLYLLPGAAQLIDDLSVPAVLVEAEKSVLALAAWAKRTNRRLLPIGLGGCYGWRGRIGKTTNSKGVRVDEVGPLSDLDYAANRQVYVLLDANAASNGDVQKARSALVRQLKKRKATVELRELPMAEGVNGPDDFLAVMGDDAMAQLLDGPEEPLPPEYSDDALTLAFTERHQDLRYTELWKKWHEWNGERWQPDETLRVFDLVRAFTRELSSGCSEKRVAQHLASAHTVVTIERLARSDRRHAATTDQWDADPWLLNTPTGVIDLRTGEVSPHRAEDYCSKITAVGPDRGAGAPLFAKFLSRVLAEDEALIRYLQTLSGLCLTGITDEHCFPFLYGRGANGKSTFISVISGILSDYSRTAAMEVFLNSKQDRHPTEVAYLAGARLVTAIETKNGRRWDESKIKALTGGDKITARFMKKDFFEFTPQFKLLIAANNKPGLRTVDEAIRRRFRLIPFTVTIPEEERDPKLGEKLRAEWPAILGWMIDGCLAWQKEGLATPESVREATDEYLASEDAVGRWLEECCELDRAYSASNHDLFASWTRWAEENKEPVGSKKNLSQELKSRDFVDYQTNRERGFRGLTVLEKRPNE
jgi:putative DNA primase/helicase